MLFFDKNFLFRNEGGSINSSSGFPEYAFDDNKRYTWLTTDQADDTDLAYVERYLPYQAKFDTLIITSTNIKDLTLLYKIEGDLEADPWRAWDFDTVKTVSFDGLSNWFKIDMTSYITAIRVEGKETIVPNEEKQICSIYGFNQVGEIYGFDRVTAEKNRNQKRSVVESGGVFIANKGYYWILKVGVKGVTTTEDVLTLNTIRNFERQFYVWINGGYDKNQLARQEPYLFEDIVKVAITGKNKPLYYKDYFNLGVVDTVTMQEMGKIY